MIRTGISLRLEHRWDKCLSRISLQMPGYMPGFWSGPARHGRRNQSSLPDLLPEAPATMWLSFRDRCGKLRSRRPPAPDVRRPGWQSSGRRWWFCPPGIIGGWRLQWPDFPRWFSSGYSEDCRRRDGFVRMSAGELRPGTG